MALRPYSFFSLAPISGSEGRLHCGVHLTPLFTDKTTARASGVPGVASGVQHEDQAVISARLIKADRNSNETGARFNQGKSKEPSGKRERMKKAATEICLNINLEEPDHHGSDSQPVEGITRSDKRNVLWICGVVKHCAVCPSWLHPTKGFSVIAVADYETKQQTAASGATWNSSNLSSQFQELLLALARENLLMVCIDQMAPHLELHALCGC